MSVNPKAVTVAPVQAGSACVLHRRAVVMAVACADQALVGARVREKRQGEDMTAERGEFMVNHLFSWKFDS